MEQCEISRKTLDDIIRRVVEVADPNRIILFGSVARGEMNRHSDVDLLVVKDAPDLRQLTVEVYRRLYGVGVAVDLVMVTPQDVERYKDSHALIIKPALREGTVMYEWEHREAIAIAEAVIRWAEERL